MSPQHSREPAPETDLVITDVRITPQEDGALRAFATITLNDCFVVRGLKVIQGMKGRFVAMPTRQRRDGTYQDIAHPINRQFRAYLEAVVLREFTAEVGEEVASAHADPGENG